VWEENEFWIELSWRIDPDGTLGIRQAHESEARPGEKLTVDEYYGWIFDHSVPGLPERAAAEGLTPLNFMRRYGAFQITSEVGPRHEEEVPCQRLVDPAYGPLGQVYCATPAVPTQNVVPLPSPDPDPDGRRRVGVLVDGRVLRGFPTPSGRLEFWSSTLAAWGWREHALPGYIRSQVHPAALGPGEMPLISTFRLPVQVHTRSANSKWLDEIAHTNPLWLHPTDAARFDVATGDLVRVETQIGHFVLKAWVTEGIRPGVVACSHHMGRWKPEGHKTGQHQMMATVALERSAEGWAMQRKSGVAPYSSSDPDTSRIWWTEGGVHQNLTFAVQPDPISGQHCWHQAVRVRKAEPGEEAGDIAVDTEAAHEVYRRWLTLTRPAGLVSPDGTRRPHWLLRPLRPGREEYQLDPVLADLPGA
jgi:anaerobic selenocysteine-containing dehydrogenase